MLADAWIWLSPPCLSSSAPETETSKSYSWIETCYSVISLLGSWRETDGSYIKAGVHRRFLLHQIMQKSNKINKCIKRKEKNIRQWIHLVCAHPLLSSAGLSLPPGGCECRCTSAARVCVQQLRRTWRVALCLLCAGFPALKGRCESAPASYRCTGLDASRQQLPTHSLIKKEKEKRRVLATGRIWSPVVSRELYRMIVDQTLFSS